MSGRAIEVPSRLLALVGLDGVGEHHFLAHVSFIEPSSDNQHGGAGTAQC